jgi:hypothetical protein
VVQYVTQGLAACKGKAERALRCAPPSLPNRCLVQECSERDGSV